MDSTLFSKMELLRDLYVDYQYDPVWQDFFEQHDLGIPLSVVAVYGMAEPTKSGELEVLLTWNNLCKLLDVDPSGEYATVEEMIG
jgi:hypothetical protein